MKVCFVGTGSIGKKHIKNLSDICKARGVQLEIHVLRSNYKPINWDMHTLITKECYDRDDLDEQYDAIFITNPTAYHYNALKSLKNYTNKFFIEKPVFDSKEYDLQELGLSEDTVCYVACPLRYDPILVKAKEVFRQITPYSIRVICSSYLPEWRKGVDYRSVYSARSELGGGVCLDLIHEWDYIVDLLGMPEEVYKVYGKYSDLQINTEDLAVYIGRYTDKLVEIHLDYFGKKNQRKMEVYTKEGIWIFDLVNNQISFNDRVIEVFFESPNEKYIREMTYFLDIPEGDKISVNSLQRALQVISLAK